MSIVVDTSVWIDFFRNADNQAVRLLVQAITANQVIVPDIVLLETLRGAPSESAALKMESALSELEFVSFGGRTLAVSAARNYRTLRTKGVTVRGSIDLMIGTWCILNRAPLLHSDRDFTPMEQHLGLQCVPTNMFQ